MISLLKEGQELAGLGGWEMDLLAGNLSGVALSDLRALAPRR